VRCKLCNFAFVNPRPSLQNITDFYTTKQVNYGNKTLNDVLRDEIKCPNSSIDAQRMIKTIADLIRAKTEVPKFLDVGCGYGFFSKQALSQGFDVTALEIATEDALLAEQMTGVKPIHSTFENFSNDHLYDAVLMSQILEHVFDANGWIQKARELLAPDGILALATPNFSSFARLLLDHRDPYISPPVHLNFFSPGSLSTLLNKHHFRVEKIQWASRISARSSIGTLKNNRTFELICGQIDTLAKPVLRTLDSFHLGIMINVYARKRAK